MTPARADRRGGGSPWWILQEVLQSWYHCCYLPLCCQTKARAGVTPWAVNTFCLLCCHPCGALHAPLALLLLIQQVYCMCAKGDPASQAGVRPGLGLMRLWPVRPLLNQYFLRRSVTSHLAEPSLFFVVPPSCVLREPPIPTSCEFYNPLLPFSSSCSCYYKPRREVYTSGEEH